MILIVQIKEQNFNCNYSTLSWQFIESSSLICNANQWTGFYMIRTSNIKELKISSENGGRENIFLPRSVSYCLYFQMPSEIALLHFFDWSGIVPRCAGHSTQRRVDTTPICNKNHFAMTCICKLPSIVWHFWKIGYVMKCRFSLAWYTQIPDREILQSIKFSKPEEE